MYVMSTDVWSALSDTAYVEERDQRFVKNLRSRTYLVGWVALRSTGSIPSGDGLAEHHSCRGGWCGAE